MPCVACVELSPDSIGAIGSRGGVCVATGPCRRRRLPRTSGTWRHLVDAAPWRLAAPVLVFVESCRRSALWCFGLHKSVASRTARGVGTQQAISEAGSSRARNKTCPCAPAELGDAVDAFLCRLSRIHSALIPKAAGGRLPHSRGVWCRAWSPRLLSSALQCGGSQRGQPAKAVRSGILPQLIASCGTCISQHQGRRGARTAQAAIRSRAPERPAKRSNPLPPAGTCRVRKPHWSARRQARPDTID